MRSARDVCPDTGPARLSNGKARALLDQHTAPAGPGTSWDLHERWHSSLTHLGEQGASLLILRAKSRHKKAENVRRCFKPSAEAIAEVTSLLAPGDARRGAGVRFGRCPRVCRPGFSCDGGRPAHPPIQPWREASQAVSRRLTSSGRSCWIQCPQPSRMWVEARAGRVAG